MKKFTILYVLLLCGIFSYSQVTAPAASPLSKVEQKVGLTDVTIEYSRPSMKGRTIFGDLVPYGKLWRTGANARTKITFSNDVAIGGNELKKGTYALLTIPDRNKWDIIFYTEHQASGAPSEIDNSKVAVRLSVTPITTTMKMETFTIHMGNLSNNGGTLMLMWDNTMVPVNFTVPTDTQVMASIERALNGPSPADYYTAAMYYYDEGKDLKQAKEWMDKALENNKKPAFWQLRQKSLIYAKAGDKKGAIEAARQSLTAAQEAGNDDYVKMNRDSLKEWGAN